MLFYNVGYLLSVVVAYLCFAIFVAPLTSSLVWIYV